MHSKHDPWRGKPHDDEAHAAILLHYRTFVGRDGRPFPICGLCKSAWPCQGAQEQIMLVKRGADHWWYVPKLDPS